MGLNAIEKAAQQILLTAEKEPGLRGVMTTFNSKSPQLQLASTEPWPNHWALQ